MGQERGVQLGHARHHGVGTCVLEAIGLARLVGVADAVGAGGLGALDVGGGVADEGAGGRVAVERVERPQDKVGVRFEQPRIRVGAADDYVDVLGQMMGL